MFFMAERTKRKKVAENKWKEKGTREFGEREFSLKQHGSASKDFTDGQQINILR